MTNLTENDVRETLRRVNDPELHQDLVALNMVKAVAICDGHVKVTVELTTPACPLKDTISKDVQREVCKLDAVQAVEVDFTARVVGTQRDRTVLKDVKNIVAVGAGKGGVGKSSIAVALAVGLARSGASVGLMDGDVYGPSVPTMMGLKDSQPSVRENQIMPIEAFEVKTISIGYMVEADKALVWRGPMVHGVTKQFLEQVEWGELDYLIVDLPPGTGDVVLTMSQLVPLTGAVIVCTPQEVALADTRRAVAMFNQVNVPVLGLVENMSYFVGDDGKEYDIFGRGGAKSVAEQLELPFMGEVPINTAIRVNSDAGRPDRNFEADDALSASLDAMVKNIAGQITIRNLLKTAPIELEQS